MCKILHPKFALIVILFFLSLVIKNCENFQLKDLGKPSEDDGPLDKPASTLGQKFHFRRLEAKQIKFEIPDDDEDDNNSNEENDNFVFQKVRKPSFEVKKRNLRPSKIAELLESDDNSDSDSQEEEDQDQDEQPSFFSKVMSFFRREKSESEQQLDNDHENDENSDESGEEEESSGDEIEEKPENKPFFVSVFEKVTGG
jgi:hypothetical protein